MDRKQREQPQTKKWQQLNDVKNMQSTGRMTVYLTINFLMLFGLGKEYLSGLKMFQECGVNR